MLKLVLRGNNWKERRKERENEGGKEEGKEGGKRQEGGREEMREGGGKAFGLFKGWLILYSIQTSTAQKNKGKHSI